MPTYRTTCTCGELEQWFSIHTGVPDVCPACAGPLTQILTPPVIRSTEGQRVIRADAQLHRDRDAYRRMRDDGLQPAQIDGCALVEGKANTQFEVETGYLYKDPTDRKRFEEARRQGVEAQADADSRRVSA